MSEVQHQPRADAIDREEIIAALRAHQTELHRRGIRHVALFGSVARREGKRTSDIDILIELDPQAPIGLFEYVGITQYPADLFPVRVDIANRRSLKSRSSGLMSSATRFMLLTAASAPSRG